MTPNSKVAEQLRKQIESTASEEYSFQAVEMKIVAALVEQGSFSGHLNEQELTSVIRNVVYARFADQRIGGREIDLVHNVPAIKVTLSGGEAKVGFLVHLHKPITAFLRFRYVLTNDPFSDPRGIRLKRGTLSVRKDTRRFDFKAKAALAAIDVECIAREELTDLGEILKRTLSDQMNENGISGEISDIQLQIEQNCLAVNLVGDVRPIDPQVALESI